ncbi:MAG: hypothetical protein ACQEP9_02915 [Bacillota bacterium]
MISHKVRIYLLVVMLIVISILFYVGQTLGAGDYEEGFVGGYNAELKLALDLDLQDLDAQDEIVVRQRPAFYFFKKVLNKNRLKYDLEAKVFQLDRNNLGANFEEELYKLVKNNIYIAYKCGMFLLEENYLYDNPASPQVALNVFDLGLEVEATNRVLKYRRVGLLVLAAIANQKYASTKKAQSLKREAEELLKKDQALSAGFPALTDEDIATYESISSK